MDFAYAVLALAVLVAMLLYQLRYRQPAREPARRRRPLLMLLAIAALPVLYLFAQQSAGKLPFSGQRTLVALAVDVSLSMGTRPDPVMYPDVDTRLVRVQKTILPVLAMADATDARVMVAVTAFTSQSEVIIGWDDNLPQIQEAIAYVLGPELLTEPGSNIGAGLRGAVPLFDAAPESWRESDSLKYLLVVSDGEQTVDGPDFEAAASKLRDKGVRIVALHVGLQGIAEGLPVYDASDAFIGFEEIGGQIASVPDPGFMASLAGGNPDFGLYVKAEDDNAAQQIMQYVGVSESSEKSDPWRTAFIVLLWSLTVALLLRYL